MHVLDFLEKVQNTEEGRIFHYLHNLMSTYDGVQSKVMFNTPFYTRNKWLAYLSTQKKGGVELCFVQANRFLDPTVFLDFKKRKQVAGIHYDKVADIDVVIFDLLMKQALVVDENFKSKKGKM